ncbi:MAG: PIN domain-containing protein [Nocardioidaceae bacterium]
MLICDTSGLLARYDPDEVSHKATRTALAGASPPFVLSPLVLAELDHLLRARHRLDAVRAVLDDLVSRGFEHPHLDATALRSCLDVDKRYADLNLGMTDASLVVLAARYRTRDILTLDHRHFRAVVPRQGGSFRLLPTDC